MPKQILHGELPNTPALYQGASSLAPKAPQKNAGLQPLSAASQTCGIAIQCPASFATCEPGNNKSRARPLAKTVNTPGVSSTTVVPQWLGVLIPSNRTRSRSAFSDRPCAAQSLRFATRTATKEEFLRESGKLARPFASVITSSLHSPRRKSRSSYPATNTKCTCASGAPSFPLRIRIVIGSGCIAGKLCSLLPMEPGNASVITQSTSQGMRNVVMHNRSADRPRSEISKKQTPSAHPLVPSAPGSLGHPVKPLPPNAPALVAPASRPAVAGVSPTPAPANPPPKGVPRVSILRPGNCSRRTPWLCIRARVHSRRKGSKKEWGFSP